MEKLIHNQALALESGAILPKLEIAYCTFGELNAAKDNAVWICHALTANADASDWWEGLVGEGKLFDPAKHFIVCANMLGSCYGTTGATHINPETGEIFGRDFPLITLRDMVHSHQILQRHLGIEKIKLAIGGSMGGQQALEWAVMEPQLFENICLLATNARHSPWGIAFNEAQRMAIEADPTLLDGSPEAGRKGLETARAIAMLSYRNYLTFEETQAENSDEKKEDFRASSYQRHQGFKLWKRFDVLSYLTLSKAMDSHNVGRGRGGVEAALQRIQAKTLVIGIQSDVLFPVEEQVFLAKHIPGARLEIIDSLYGHDGFLIENEAIANLIRSLLKPKSEPYSHEIKVKETYLQGVRQYQKAALPGTESF